MSTHIGITQAQRIDNLTQQLMVVTNLDAALITAAGGGSIISPGTHIYTLMIQAGVIATGLDPTAATLGAITSANNAFRDQINNEIISLTGEVLSDVLRQTVMDTGIDAAESSAELAQQYADSAEEAFLEAERAVEAGEPGALQRLTDAASTFTY